jgi:tRNA (guanosine-2'-O-)-methyltransferase
VNYADLDKYIDALGAERVVAGLEPFLSEARLRSIDRVVSARLSSIHVGVERPEDPYNAAALVRTAEAFGIMNVHVVGVEHGALHARRTTQGSFNWLHTRHHVGLDGLLADLRAANVRIYGALMDAPCAIDDVPVDAPFCLLFGNEATGLSEQALAAADLRFRIPMVGMSESLNLSVSAAIAMYVTSSALRRRLGTQSDLDPQAALRERARYYARSVDVRILQAL